MLNALTIDVESWQQLFYRKLTGNVISPTSKVVDDTAYVLDILSANDVRATFFILGNVAETFPDLVRRIDRAGHEIGCHGFSHSIVYHQSPSEFREETRRAKNLLQEIIGKPIHGYRAAEFSITRGSWWALDILAEEGFTYDSSIFPISGKRYGIGDFSLGRTTITTGQGNTILEFPLTSVVWRGKRWPVAGGSYFRLLPYWLTRAAIREVHLQGRPAILYFHPYEFAENKLDAALLKPAPRTYFTYIKYSTLHNFARERLRKNFTKLLSDFKFVPIRELVRACCPNQGGVAGSKFELEQGGF